MTRIHPLIGSLLGLALAAMAVAMAGPAQAQLALEERARLPSGTAYLEAKGRAIDADVVYYDPALPAPRLRTSEAPEPEAGRGSAREGDLLPGEGVAADLRVTLVSLLVLGALFFIVWRYGPAMSVPLRKGEADQARRRDRPARPATEAAPELASLTTILAIPDRQQALIQLARGVLAQVLAANDLLAQSSWTLRDALRRVPPSQSHREALSQLLFAAEGAQFGDRPVNEADFTAHLERIRPLLRELSP
ncbi:MAG: hypothetical protein AAGC57_01795 [Pseudomonadota bacterium]